MKVQDCLNKKCKITVSCLKMGLNHLAWFYPVFQHLEISLLLHCLWNFKEEIRETGLYHGLWKGTHDILSNSTANQGRTIWGMNNKHVQSMLLSAQPGVGRGLIHVLPETSSRAWQISSLTWMATQRLVYHMCGWEKAEGRVQFFVPLNHWSVTFTNWRKKTGINETWVSLSQWTWVTKNKVPIEEGE